MLTKIKGATLIEAIITVTLLGVILAPSCIFLFESLSGTIKSQDAIAASSLARLELEITNNLAYGNIASRTVSYPNYDLSRTITYLNGDSDIMEIRVNVYPKGKLNNPDYLLMSAITHRTSYAQ